MFRHKFSLLVVRPSQWGKILFVEPGCEGAVMAASARTVLSLFLIYAVSNVCFRTKIHEIHLFDMDKCPDPPKIELREGNMEYFAVVVCRCGKTKLQLTSTGYHKLRVAAIRWGKSGNTTLTIPGHDPPFEITILNDVALNPGPDTSLSSENQVRAGHRALAEHCAENLFRLPPQAYSRQQLMDLRRHCCFPSSSTITLLKQCGIFKFRGRRGGRNRRIQRHYANFPVRSRPLFRRAVNPDNLVPIKKGPSQASTPTSCQFHFCLLNTRSVKNKIMKVKDFVVDHDIDILAITETWLRPGNVDEVDIGTLCSSGYRFLHVPRSYSSGGGVGLLFKETLQV